MGGNSVSVCESSFPIKNSLKRTKEDAQILSRSLTLVGRCLVPRQVKPLFLLIKATQCNQKAGHRKLPSGGSQDEYQYIWHTSKEGHSETILTTVLNFF